FGGQYLLAGDAFFYNYPLRTVAWRMIRAGEWPLWTPYLMSGYPLLSMAQIGLGYPLTWGYLFLPGRIAEQIYVLAPFLLAPLFTYAYAREIGRSPLAALVAALSFGYGGASASPLGGNGLMPNACMWLPLLLIAIERARTRRFVPCLVGATAAYALSVLNGVAQGFLYVGLVAVAYALFLVLTTDEARATSAATLRTRLAHLRQWRPLLLSIGAITLAMGVAAFQLLETARAVKHSIRRTLSYEVITQGSATPMLLLKSLCTPFVSVLDTNANVPLLTLALALVAVWALARQKRARDLRVFFWFATAALALWLMLGANTPLYRVVYHIPFLNSFRVPMRHAFEWTFAVSMLAAYGWDAVAAYYVRRRAPTRARKLDALGALALLLISAAIGARWWWQVWTWGLQLSIRDYLLWKVAFSLLTLGAIWCASKITGPRLRMGLLLAALLLLCYVEPSALINGRWWGRLGLPASRFAVASDATRFLLQFPPEQNRVYTRVELMSEQGATHPRLDAANLSAVFGLHNVAGYEPLILDRYSRALGDADRDLVHTIKQGTPDRTLFTARSHVLDILNDRFVVSYADLATALDDASARSSRTAEMEVLGEVVPQETKRLTVAPTETDALIIVSSLSNSTAVPNNQTVARVRVFTTDGRIIERDMRAGVETAEWAHDRPDVRANIRHKLAPIFDSTPINEAGGYTAYRYKATLSLGETAHVSRVEITNVSQAARLGLYGAVLFDARTQTRTPLTLAYADTWQPVYEQNSTLILRNTRAQPRAWLVAEAEAVDGEEALSRIRGESTHEFDPARTALLEVHAHELPRLPGGALAPESVARITRYEPNRLQIETSAPTATVLVVSELFYPGWTATVDGRAAPIMLTDFLLRSVALPAGTHTIEMRYTAPSARIGALISVCTLLLLGALYWRGARR
ncbi:MAG TPA: YfhO family protein, partial [Pyrinomonadaceae bacterium]|nr:YfhO family protein [Pyrinomonadaceae bacterium]